MLRVIVIVLGLVAASFTYTLKSDWSPSKVDREGGNENEQYRFNSDEKDEASSRDRNNGPPKPKPLDKICAKIECPKFEKLNISGSGFEARKIFAANWTQTPIDIKHMDSGIQTAFRRLFKYISGANDQGVKIPMTAPVLYTWTMDKQYKLVAGYMNVYLPSAFQSNPPVPTDDQVSVVSWSDSVVYDRAFGGDMDPKVYTKQFQLLYKALVKAGITIYPYMSVTAAYTEPGHGRQRNEVMFVDNGSM